MTPHEIGAVIEAVAKTVEQERQWIDYCAAKVCAISAEPHRDRKKEPYPFSARDFMANPPPKRKQTPEEMKQKMMAWCTAVGGEVR